MITKRCVEKWFIRYCTIQHTTKGKYFWHMGFCPLESPKWNLFVSNTSIIYLTSTVRQYLEFDGTCGESSYYPDILRYGDIICDLTWNSWTIHSKAPSTSFQQRRLRCPTKVLINLLSNSKLRHHAVFVLSQATDFSSQTQMLLFKVFK